MIIQGITRGLTKAKASLTLDNMAFSEPFSSGMPRAVEMVGGRFATYEALYRTQPWVYATVNRIARGLSRLPIGVYIDGGQPGERERVRDGTLFELLRHPWTTQTAPVIQDGNTALMVQCMIHNALVHGYNIFLKDYSLPNGRRASEPTGLIPAKPYNFRPIFHANTGRFSYWELRSPAGTIPVFPEEVWILAPWGIGPSAGMSFNSPWDGGGLPTSPMEAIRTTLISEDAIQRAIIQRFEKGARPAGFISFKETVKNLKEAREMIDEEYGGVDNYYKTAMLDQGATWQEMGGSFVDSEMSQLRKLNREEVTAVMNVPPSSVGSLERSTHSNITESHLMEYQDTYGPWATQAEESFQVQVIDPEPAWRGRYIEFNFQAVLRGDPIQELAGLVRATGGPVLASNEGRARLNLPPLPGGDTLREPQNMSTGAQDPNDNQFGRGGDGNGYQSSP